MSEALQMMKPGAKWEIYVPAKLAYGEEGGIGVGPNAAIIYDLELVSLLPGRPQPTAAQIEEMNKN
jgi:FKBP-type peptidyl-prolyl cis-trans isomerase